MTSADPRRRGARLVHLPDWPFGAVGRRQLLEALLLDRQPDGGWTKRGLEERVGVANGGLDDLLAGAIDLGLAGIEDGRIRRVAAIDEEQILPPPSTPDLVGALSEALRAVRALPDRPVRALPRRPYSSG